MASTTRLTGGAFRGRTLSLPPTQKVRPTLSRVREALFDQVQTLVPGAKVLDLFCGSGAQGFEALSRGADFCAFVDRDCTHVIKNLKELKLEGQAKVLRTELPKGKDRFVKLGPFDLVLVDPPYRDQWHAWVLDELPWEKLLAQGGRLILESAKDQKMLPPPASLTRVRERDYGSVRLESFELSEDET